MVNNTKLIIFLLALLVAPFSYSAGLGDLIDRNGRIITPGSGTVSVQSVIQKAATAPNGTRAIVPVNVAVQVPKATLALNAAKIARGAAGPLGAAFLGYEIYNAIKESGVTTCAAPDFFCAPAPTTSALAQFRYCEATAACNTWQSDPQTACTAWATASGSDWTVKRQPVLPETACLIGHKTTETNNIGRNAFTRCSDGSPYSTDPVTSMPRCGSGTTTAAPIPFSTDQALADAMTANNWGPELTRRIWENTSNQMAKDYGVNADQSLGLDTPVTVSGSPVTTPQVTTSTKTSPNPDGSTSTEVQKEQTTFTPAKDGSTVKDAVPKVSTSTVVTTTTTNNTTNVTNTTTQTQTPPKTAEEEKSDLCKENPDIVACKKLTTLEATPVKNENKPVSITSSTGWGASNGACPAPGSFTAMGTVIPVPWDVFCDFASGIRPFLIAVGYMIAVGGFLGLSRKD